MGQAGSGGNGAAAGGERKWGKTKVCLGKHPVIWTGPFRFPELVTRGRNSLASRFPPRGRVPSPEADLSKAPVKASRGGALEFASDLFENL